MNDDGTAIVEFVFLAVVVMVPLVYVLAAAAAIQRSQLAVSQAAREAGRALATSESASEADGRVAAAVRLAFEAHGLHSDATVKFVASDAPCDGPPVEPELRAGASFTVCVLRRTTVPGVPGLLAGRGIESVGRFIVHTDDYRTVRP